LSGDFGIGDPRYGELLFRYRARNWPDTLDAGERDRWDAFRRQRIMGGHPLSTLSLAGYFASLARLRSEPDAGDGRFALLDTLEQWGRDLASELDLELPA
jgi:exodeoxyribonuclease-1